MKFVGSFFIGSWWFQILSFVWGAFVVLDVVGGFSRFFKVKHCDFFW